MPMQLPATATLEQARALVEQLDAALADSGAAAFTIDAAALRDFDTSAIALLLHAQRAARRGGGRVEISGAPAKLVELARLYGVDELLGLQAA